MNSIRSWLTPNPILVKELRSRMRGPRAFLTLTGALVIMAGLMIGLASLLTRNTNSFGNMLSPQIGQALFDGLVLFELMLVCTVTPAVTAGAISSEREKLTFEMLLSTPLGPAQIVWGKLISALSYVFLMIFAAVPLASLVFMFGGIAPLTMFKGLGMLLVAAVSLGIYGLFLSALLGRTGRATVVGFVTVMALSVGPLIAMIAAGLFYGARVLVLPRLLLAFSPVSMLISAVETTSTNSGGVNSLFGFIGGQWDVSMNPQALTQIPRPIYHYSLALCALLSIVLFTLTIGLIHPARRFHLSKRTLVTSGSLLAVCLAVIGGAYWLTAPRYEWVLTTGGQTGTKPVELLVSRPSKGFAVAVPAPTIDLPGPTPTPAVPPGAGKDGKVLTAQTEGWPAGEQSAVYAEVIRKAVTDLLGPRKDLAASTTRLSALYVVSKTNDKTGSPDTQDAGPQAISPEIQSGLARPLADLAPRLTWVNGIEEIKLVPPDDAVPEGGLLINLGNIQVQFDGSVLVPVSVYQTSLSGGGQTYQLAQRSNAGWQVVGTVGTSWIQ
jgi:ABC-type transport system involved in multi-copper enzyme maturation permease subunit